MYSCIQLCIYSANNSFYYNFGSKPFHFESPLNAKTKRNSNKNKMYAKNSDE